MTTKTKYDQEERGPILSVQVAISGLDKEWEVAVGINCWNFYQGFTDQPTTALAMAKEQLDKIEEWRLEGFTVGDIQADYIKARATNGSQD